MINSLALSTGAELDVAATIQPKFHRQVLLNFAHLPTKGEALPPAPYQATINTIGLQPENVRTVMGEKGKNLTGNKVSEFNFGLGLEKWISQKIYFRSSSGWFDCRKVGVCEVLMAFLTEYRFLKFPQRYCRLHQVTFKHIKHYSYLKKAAPMAFTIGTKTNVGSTLFTTGRVVSINPTQVIDGRQVNDVQIRVR